MSSLSTTLETATTWDEICFPVYLESITSYLPEGYELLATDRKKAVVGETHPGRKSIFALQSDEYSLVPNALIRDITDSCFEDYQVQTKYTDRGEFSISLILPEDLKIGNEKIYKTMIINNSYNGKTPFSLQGTIVRNLTETTTETKMRISYWREICSNGLMGWADDYLSMDEYLNWLANGKPKKYKAKKMKTEVAEITTTKIEEDVEVLVQNKLSHKGLDLARFAKYLRNTFELFKFNRNLSVTGKIYERLATTKAPEDVQKVMVEAGLPKMLARQAITRLKKEERELQTEGNLWLVYNAMNFALFNSQSSLTINDRYRLDEAALHQMANLTL